MSITGGKSFSRLINSNDLDVSENAQSYYASINVVRVDKSGSRIETWESISSLNPESLDSLLEKISINLKYAEKTDSIENGKIPVYITPRGFTSFIGILLQGLTAKSLFKHVSPFEGKFNTKLFNESLTLIDNPLLDNSLHSYSFDDEGIPAQKTTLIENGIIKNFVSDIKYAKLMNVAPSGNSSRGYAYPPGISFSNIEVQEGNIHSKDLIKSISNGIIAHQFIGLGQSNTITGDFSTNLDLAFRVKNGEITGRLKDCMISGNIFSLLENNYQLTSDKEKHGNLFIPGVLFDAVDFSS
jgi:PmbA protein